MNDKEREHWEQYLKEGEKILWTGAPRKNGLVDPENKLVFWLELIFGIAWFIITMAMFSARVSGLFALVIMELPALIAILIPFNDARTVSNTFYAITDRRVIIRSGNDDHSMAYNSSTRVDRRSNDTICIGTAADIKPSRERHFLLFHGVQDDEKNVTGVVLYTTSDPDGAMKALGK